MGQSIFRTELLDYATKLDAVTNSCGEIVKAASAIADEHDMESTVHLVSMTSKIIKSSDYSKDIKRLASAFKDSIMKFYGYFYITEATATSFGSSEEDFKTLSELLDDLNRLVGLKNVKSKVNDLIAYQNIHTLRELNGLHSQKGTMHLAFTGNPGTGKTTVARIVGRIYKQLGLLSKGHFVEVSRTDLIAGYQGQTAHKVKKVIEQAKGGVLFIDEAYSITENDHSDSYGRECLTELTKALEDYREDLVVIVAGYSKPMEHFFASNPGLISRINTIIEFPNYCDEELYEMLNNLCMQNDYSLSEEATCIIQNYLHNQINTNESTFSNGRFVRNLYDDLVMNHAKRIFKSYPKTSNHQLLSLITKEDLPIFMSP